MFMNLMFAILFLWFSSVQASTRAKIYPTPLLSPSSQPSTLMKRTDHSRSTLGMHPTLSDLIGTESMASQADPIVRSAPPLTPSLSISASSQILGANYAIPMSLFNLAHRSPEPIFMISPQSVILYSNPEASRIFGWTHQELKQMKPSQFLQKMDRLLTQHCQNALLPFVKEEGHAYYLGITKTGERLFFRTMLVPITENADQSVLMLTLRDVSAQISEMEHVQESKENLELAARSLSHDIRTPLQILTGLFEELKEDSISQAHKMLLLAQIQAALQSLVDISNTHVLHSHLEVSTFSLSDLLENLILTYQDSGKRKGIRFILFVDPDVPNYLLLNRSSIVRILTNLLSNAIKYTNQGEIKLTACMQHHSNSALHLNPTCPDILHIEVSDTGLGLPAEEIPFVFTPRWRSPRHLERGIPGSGLGLSGAKILVEQLTGTIGMRSVLHVGSTVWVNLPIPLDKQVTLTSPRSGQQKNLNRSVETLLLRGQFKILLVDDTPVILKLYERLIKKIGYACDLAHDGYEALEKMKENSYALILMDNNMPNLTGIEVTRIIRQMIDLKPQPIILILSGDATPDTRVIALSAGVDEFYIKPIEEKRLEDILDRRLLPSESSDLQPEESSQSH